ncbi:ABC transporter ATP-binding protein [Pseudomonas sp. LPB0260]|uniref:ABC transporter transmembrane domain-containing protein n=1 Tax=Pseudomonas sp. LPB0260 TaxID=2614442 RepID=UPI0015C246DF|nr:ABC transporter ATP-binding protein [Pseudomonas sp. LPB0260]QLC74630.1 ABC transporter ATP-binding protein [Pseudomonas sp. LPB0260]QLC77398.1 ABC transporter ATP-binding protein [Pseudomonas sp. LPB0260]
MSRLAEVTGNRRWLGLVGLSLIGMLQSLSLLFFIMQIRNRIMAQEGPFLEGLLLLVPLVFLLSAGRFMERTVAEKLAQSYVHEVRTQIFEHFLCLPTADALRVGRGTLLMRLTGDLLALRNWLVEGVARMTVLTVWLSVALVTLLVLDPLLVAVLGGLAAAAVPIYWLGGRYFYDASSNTRKHRSRLMNYMSQRIAAVTLIQSVNQAGREARRFRRLSNDMHRWQLKRAQGGGWLRAGTEFISLTLVGLLALVGHSRVLSGHLSADEFVMVIIVSLYMLPQMRRLGRIYEYWTQYQLARFKLQRFLRRNPVAPGGRRLKLPVGAPVSVTLSIAAEGGVERRLSAPAGARVLLSGASGSGKSRLLRAMAGIEPMPGLSGSLDAISLDELAASERQRRIVLIGEPATFWQTSIRENLIYGMRRGDQPDIEQVIDLCGLRSLAERLPNGLDSRLGAKGIQLSSAEEFRLMLARGLLRRPSLLLIDHASASSDSTIDELLAKVGSTFPGTMIVARSDASKPQWATKYWTLSAPPLGVVKPISTTVRTASGETHHENS